MSNIEERELLLRETQKIVSALGQTLSPMCEVVLHDLRSKDQSIVAIENNLSGRSVGDSATELGIARMEDPNYPDIIANYANQFPDGRAAKSTSIGVKDSNGDFVAAICLNIDISYLQSITSYLGKLTRLDTQDSPSETLHPNGISIEEKVREFSSGLNKSPTALSIDEKRKLVQDLSNSGDLNQRGAADRVAAVIGGSRSNIYYYLRKF